MAEPLKLTQTQSKGRALITTKPLKAGEIILTDSPILLYSATTSTTSPYCSHCYRTITQTPIPCPNCPTHFCSLNCLSSSHTPFLCQSLLRLVSTPSDNPEHSLQARYLIAAYNLALYSKPAFKLLMSLQGDGSVDEGVQFVHSLVSSVFGGGVLDLGGEFRFSVELTGALLAKDKLNAFGLMEGLKEGGERSVRAYGVYPKASFFNHDCLPNACRFDYVDGGGEGGRSNTDIVVRAIHDVEEGREICLSYFPVNLKYSERQKRLKEDYGFTCDCDRCNVEANWSDDEEEEGGMEGEDMDEGEDDEDMEEEGDNDMVRENDDFPHAYFFVRYMCSRDNCGGTLAPLPPTDARPSTLMECNVCGNVSNSEEMEGS